MNVILTPDSLAAKVTVRGINLELTEELRQAATEKTARLLSQNPQICRVQLELERDPNSRPVDPFVAKAEVDFGGPALFTSVTAQDPIQALDYLMEKLDHQLRRQRVRHGADAPKRRPPAAAAKTR